MSAETVLRNGTWILAILLPLAAAWFATSWLRTSRTTLVVRGLFSASLALLASPRIHEWAMDPFSRATWRCSVCGTSEYQVRCFDRVVYRTGRHPSYGVNVAALASGVPHEHDWLFFESILAFGDRGCACSADIEDAYFSCLEKVPSPEIARTMIVRVADAPLERRRAMIQLFTPRNLGEPFVSLNKGVTPTREKFEKDYVVWLDRHPEWR
jgi:hypothetical protein